ncbi:TPA: LexA family protein [Pseudomonas aeruginosa]|uniref:LexA family protein n=1 Tax=Pseudomonas aeruginosa TaxID=287 RepID=UPI000FD6204F|nr:S24 family peptidase [Pseudomonas aeruginosa]RUB35125.1 helix-turn-helix domain-containing protein [Pseudomonas aeruginosa]
MARQDITQAQLAEQMGKTQGAVAHWLNGRREPSIADINQMLTLLNLPPLTIQLPDDRMQNVAPADQPTRMYRYPIVSWVAAGAWREAIELAGFDTFELSDYKSKGRSFWLEVKGDSMTAPAGESIPEGMLILVDTGLEPRPGDLVVAKLADSNEATFKQFVSDAGQKYLKPLNPAYRMLSIDDNCEMVGVVTRAIRKFR